jgi:hypothetical protein
MTDQRKRPGIAFYSALIAAALILYPLSLMPACWLSARFGGERIVTTVYKPLTWCAELTGSQSLMNTIQSYSGLGTGGTWIWTFYTARPPGNAKWCNVLLENRPSSGPGPP